MDEQEPWSILAEQGILFRPSLQYREGWEYAMPTFVASWYGPYATRAEALRAALRQLLSMVALTAGSTSDAESLAAQVQALQRRLSALHLEWAMRGGMYSADLDPQIDDVREQIKRLKRRLEQAGDEPAS